MPVHYAADNARRRIRLTLTNPVAVEDLVASVERQFADGAWQYGLLVDLRAPFTVPATDDVRLFASRVGELTALHGPRGPVAVVAKESGPISSAQMYLVFGGRTESMEVFWDLADGQEWLDERMAHESET